MAQPTQLVNFVQRPGYGTKGRPIQVYANSYPVTAFPTNSVMQYDVTIGDGTAKRALIKKVWSCNQLKERIGPEWDAVLFDGNKLAWSAKTLSFGNELNIQIDLSKEPQFGKKKADIIRVVIKKTTTVVLEPVYQWIQGRYVNDEKVQAGITFLNHLISQSLRLDPTNICLKRSFFRERCEEMQLEGGLVVKKGLFLSVRGGQNKLMINVDVATSVFWPRGDLLSVMFKTMNPQAPFNSFPAWLAQNWADRRVQQTLKRIRRLTFFCRHTSPNKPDKDQKRFTIDAFTESDAIRTKFPRRIVSSEGEVSEVSTTVQQYFQDTYRMRLQYPALRLVRTKRGGSFPIECCYVDSDNRYTPKLDDKQTATMIKFTATRPEERRRAISDNVAACKWTSDNVLAKYGMKINTQMTQTQARILPAPTIQYGAGSTGRDVVAQQGNWNLQGKKFIQTATLKSYGMLVFCRQNEFSQGENFLKSLVSAYVGHGGQHAPEKKAPIVFARQGRDIASEVVDFFNTVGRTFGTRPQILFFVLPWKSAQPYSDIKAACDTNIGCVSQCIQLRHAQRPQAQYLSNVCMKLNAKLGGSSCHLLPKDYPLTGRKTLLIGADVSHAAPGSQKPSFASMVGSTDLSGTRYCGICDTNEFRTEMLTKANMTKFLRTMLRNFRNSTGVIPDRILYFRDGVSDQQYHQVINEEVKYMREVFATMPTKEGPYNPKLTVIICSKRHHHRFFPVKQGDGDRNGNCNPGTIMEKDITDPAEYDFYLNSHRAIQGTARATHYYVIYDENKIPVDHFQALCYNLCFTYIRSTTSVSLIPPVYYAHLASQRGRAHEAAEDQQSHAGSGSTGEVGPVKPVAPLKADVQTAMWFV